MAVVLNKAKLLRTDLLRIITLRALEFSDADRRRLPAGDYELADSFRVRIEGTIRVAADGKQLVVARADTWGLLALALDKLNTVTLDSLLAEYFAGDVSARAEALKKRTKRAIRKIKGSTSQPVRGKITKELCVSWKGI